MKDLNPVYNLLRADGSMVINKNLCHAIGINESIIYAELLSRYNYFNTREQLDENSFFFNTVNDLKEATCIGEKPQKRCINNLKKLGLIEYKLKDIPPKRYFKIIDDVNILIDLIQLGSDKMKEMHKKNLESVATSKLRLMGGIETSKVTELKPPKGRVNNTKVNNTNVNNTNFIGSVGSVTLCDYIKNNEIPFIDNEVDAITAIRYYNKCYETMFNTSLKYSIDKWNEIFINIFKSDIDDISLDVLIEAIDKHFKTKYKFKEMYLLHNFIGKTKDNRLYESGIL